MLRDERSVILLLVVAFVVLIGRVESKRPFDRVQTKTTTPLYSAGESILGIPAGILPPNRYVEEDDDDAYDDVPNVECTSAPTGGRANCSCTLGYVGKPPDCRPGPQLWTACFLGNPCGPDSECKVNAQGMRLCACIKGFVGSPPRCRPGPRYLSLCAKCGAHTECDYSGTTPICYCLPGYVGEYDKQGHLPKCSPGKDLLSRCSPYTHGPYADCQRREGGVCSCACMPGYEGKPPHCKPGPELWRVCFKDRPCGPHSLCTTHNGAPVCLPCSAGYSGKPPNCFKP